MRNSIPVTHCVLGAGSGGVHYAPPWPSSTVATAGGSVAWAATCVPRSTRLRSTAAPGRRAVGASTPPVPEPNPTAKEPLMANPATAAPTPGRTGPPWTAEGTVYFYGGFLSNFAPTPGLRLPFGYHGHHENDKVPVATVEHWFQACKATSRQQFDLILTSETSAIAKHTGRQTRLRPDWEDVKFQVMLCALRGKFALEPYRGALLLTHPHPLAENSPSDFVWGARDLDGGHSGQNLLGLALMQVRDELIADIRTRLAALAPGT